MGRVQHGDRRSAAGGGGRYGAQLSVAVRNLLSGRTAQGQPVGDAFSRVLLAPPLAEWISQSSVNNAWFVQAFNGHTGKHDAPGQDMPGSGAMPGAGSTAVPGRKSSAAAVRHGLHADRINIGVVDEKRRVAIGARAGQLGSSRWRVRGRCRAARRGRTAGERGEGRRRRHRHDDRTRLRDQPDNTDSTPGWSTFNRRRWSSIQSARPQ